MAPPSRSREREPSRLPLKLAASLVAIVAYALWWDAHRAIARSPGLLAPEAPRQESIANAAPIARGEFQLTPLARFALDARVLSREDYRIDTESSLAPTDVVFGWGRMSDSAVLERVSISQSGRWYHWSTLEPPIPFDEIARSSANMHLIAATPAVASAIARLRVGEIVALSGELVAVRRARDGWSWVSSLSRDDTGAGACEIVYVESLTKR